MTRFSHSRSAVFRQLFSFLFVAFLLVGNSQAWATEKGVAEGAKQVSPFPPRKKLPVPPAEKKKVEPAPVIADLESEGEDDSSVEDDQVFVRPPRIVAEDPDLQDETGLQETHMDQAASRLSDKWDSERTKNTDLKRKIKESNISSKEKDVDHCYPPQDPDDEKLFDICPVPHPSQFIAIPSRVLAYRPWDKTTRDFKVPSADEMTAYANKKANLVCKHLGLNDRYDYSLTAAYNELKIETNLGDKNDEKNEKNGDDQVRLDSRHKNPINVKRKLFGTKWKVSKKYQPWHYEFDGKTWEYHVAKINHRAKQVAKISSVASAGLIAVSAAVPPAAIVTAPLAGIAGATAGISAGLVKLMPHLEPMLSKTLRKSIDKANQKARINGARAYVLRKLGYIAPSKTPDAARTNYEKWKGRRPPITSNWNSPRRPQGNYNSRPGGRRPGFDDGYDSYDDYEEPARPYEDIENELEDLSYNTYVPNKPKKDLSGDIEHLVFNQLRCKRYKKNSFLRFLSRLRQKPQTTGQNVANNDQAVAESTRKPVLEHRVHPAPHDLEHRKSNSTH